MKLIIDIILCVICVSLVINIFKYIGNIRNTVKNKNQPYFKIELMKYIIELEIRFLLLDVVMIVLLLLSKGMLNMDSQVINIGCSLLTTALLSVFIYFKYLKHIPDETREQINTLLNDRLGYETTNHNATLSKGDQVQYYLSREHKDIRDEIIKTSKDIAATSKGITELSVKLDCEKELKKMQYECLNDNDKTITKSIDNLSYLSNSLKEVNYENSELKSENRRLIQENADLKQQLEQYNKINKTVSVIHITPNSLGVLTALTSLQPHKAVRLYGKMFITIT